MANAEAEAVRRREKAAMRLARRKERAAMVESWAGLRRSGMSWKDVAEKTVFATTTVWRAVIDQHPELRKGFEYSKDRLARRESRKSKVDAAGPMP